MKTIKQSMISLLDIIACKLILSSPIKAIKTTKPKGYTMKRKVYAIRDSKAEVYNTPFFQNTHGEAERSFSRLVEDPKSMIQQFPDDYDLYWIGEYDDLLGTLTALDTPQHILKAVHVAARLSEKNNAQMQ